MTQRRIPDDAFEFYVGLGPGRSYQAVADHYGVSKRAVTKRARQEKWPPRLHAIESQARQRSDHKLVDVIEEMNERHLRTARVIQAKALETLKAMPLESAMDAVRALDLGLKQERLIHGEPTDRTSTVEETIRREVASWLVVDHGGEGDLEDDEPEGPAEDTVAGGVDGRAEEGSA